METSNAGPQQRHPLTRDEAAHQTGGANGAARQRWSCPSTNKERSYSGYNQQRWSCPSNKKKRSHSGYDTPSTSGSAS